MNNTEAQEMHDRCCKEMALSLAALQQFQEHWEKASLLFYEFAKLDENTQKEGYKIIAANIMKMMNHIGLKTCEIEGLMVTRSIGKMNDRGMCLLEAQRYDPKTSDQN